MTTTAPAEIVRDDEGVRSMRWRRTYPDPVADVWSAITDSDRLGRWIGTWTGTPRIGGTVAFTMTGEADAGDEVCDPMDVTILACDPPRRLTVLMPTEGAEGAFRLDLALEPHEHGTVLTFTQRQADGEWRADMDAGWRWYLDRLAASLRDEAMPAWSAYAP